MEGPWLLLRHDKAGDAIKSLPALRALRDVVASQDLHLLVSGHNASLFEHEPGFHLHRLPPHWKQLKPDVLKTHLAYQGMPLAFSRVVSLLCDPFRETDLLLRLFQSTEKYAAATTDHSLTPHINLLKLPRNSPARRDESLNVSLLLNQALDLKNPLSLIGFSRSPVLAPADHQEAQSLMGAKTGLWMGFCPFAGLQHRSPPLKRWEAFLPHATRVPWIEKLFFFGAPADCHSLELLREQCYFPEQIQLCFPSSFRALGAYLLRLDGVVAVDSGPLHLARSLGVRSLGILSGGDTDRWFSFSRHPGDRLLKRGLLQRFPSALEMVWAFRRWASGLRGTGSLRII